MSRTNLLRAGNVSPSLIGGLVILLAGGALAWYLNSSEAPDSGVSITINDKPVDARQLMKSGSLEMKDGTKVQISGGMPLMAGMPHSEYFKLPEGPARTKFIDDFITQQEQQKKQLGITTDAEGMPKVNMPAGSPTTQPGKNVETQKVVVRASGSASDMIPPETRAQMAEFIAAVNKRRAERGLPPQQGIMMIRTTRQGDRKQ